MKTNSSAETKSMERKKGVDQSICEGNGLDKKTSCWCSLFSNDTENCNDVRNRVKTKHMLYHCKSDAITVLFHDSRLQTMPNFTENNYCFKINLIKTTEPLSDLTSVN